MRYLFWAFVLLLLLQSAGLSQIKTADLRYIDTAFSYVGTKEKTGNNDGAEVERFLKSVGRKKGDSWCAAFVSYCLTVTNHPFPIRSGLARAFVTKQSILATHVLQGIKQVSCGDLIIWQKGSSISGHIGFVAIVDDKKYITIEGNTSSGQKGAQADGDGNLHVPATGTTNSGKVLTAGATAGSLSWQPTVNSLNVGNNKDGNFLTTNTITGNPTIEFDGDEFVNNGSSGTTFRIRLGAIDGGAF